MGVLPNSVVQVTYKGLYENNVMMMVLNYKVLSNDSAVSYLSDLNSIITKFADTAAGTILTLYRALLPANYTITTIRAQQVRPTRQLFMEDSGLALLGMHATEAASGNLAATITRVSLAAGRKGVSTLHVGPLPDGAKDYGSLDPTYKAAMASLAQALINDVVIAAPSMVLAAQILHPVGAAVPSTQIETYRLGDTIRTMRRRTLGVGI